jgi:hypothetical protein
MAVVRIRIHDLIQPVTVRPNSNLKSSTALSIAIVIFNRTFGSPNRRLLRGRYNMTERKQIVRSTYKRVRDLKLGNFHVASLLSSA